MKKRKFVKFSSLAVGLAVIGILLFSLPLMGATQSSDKATEAVETTSNETDLDKIQEEVEEVGGTDEANEVSEVSDADEADEDLPGGDHEDQDGTEIEHEFGGVE